MVPLTVSREHCRACGRPFSEIPRYGTRLLCRECGLAGERLKSRVIRELYTQGVHQRGQRCRETGELKKISGRERLLRERRIARYARCVARGVPIEYEPADLS